MVNLDNLSDENTYSLLFILLSQLKDESSYSTISELAYVLDKKNFLNFISHYGGCTIKVPTAEEFHSVSKILILYHSHIDKKLSWQDSLELAGYSPEESLQAKFKLQKFQQLLNKNKKNEL